MKTTTYRTVTVPTYAHFMSEDLIEGLVTDADGASWSTGLCRTAEEAQARAADILAGRPSGTQAPDYQANELEMAAAWAKLQRIRIRDGGFCRTAVESATKAGIHTVEWAIASRYICARWV